MAVKSLLFHQHNIRNSKNETRWSSFGPGDPSAVHYAGETVKEIIGQVPIFGICMGHQLLGQALGGKTYKMKFGHHGGNHPVRNIRNGIVEISAQNHNYAVDPESLPGGVEVTHANLNDGSCAGLASPQQKLMSLQYHLEASPGPQDSDLDARLVLEDGSIWKAKSFGALGTQVGEVVFNTSLTGYQDILTDLCRPICSHDLPKHWQYWS
nr:carbamoyl-phosphate synthase small chain, chloroplastic [Tanacetum cinerariifolium]